jgi:molecular chaperone GrpE
VNGVGDETSMTQPATESSTPPSLHPEIRDRLIQQFEQWLDQMLAGEAPPAGLPQDLLAEVQGSAPGAEQQNCDLYTLFSGLTTLTGEIRLQGRAFKQLVDLLAPLSEVPERLDRLEQRSERQAGDATDLPASSKEICDVMLDLYDRLGRGLDACDKGIATLRQQRRGWLRRWIRPAQAIEQSAASAEALRDAAALMLARLESVLDQWGIERIGRIGESFDPLRMTVIQVRPTSEFEPGTVLEINRSGYALHGQLKATAQVTVARAESVMEQRDV